MDDFTFAENIRNMRKYMGLSQEKFAKKLSVSKQAVAKWENGVYPSGENLVRINKVFGASLDELFEIKAKDTKLRLNDVNSIDVIIVELEKNLNDLKSSIKKSK
ncbi:MAG: helix-turn-helix transcriptional regulator [Bacilli bacterium]